MVEVVKTDSGISISCVRLMEKLRKSEEEAEARGEARGEAIGRIKGKREELVNKVCRKMKLGQSIEKIAEDLVEDISVIEPIYSAAESLAPEYDPEIVMLRLAEAPI